MNVIEEIAAERRRHIEVEGWTPEHDDAHIYGEMAHAAAAYASHTEHREQIDVFAARAGGGQSRVGWFLPHRLLWPWAREWWKPTTRRRDLIKAGALIVAEIERLDRALQPPAGDA
jgi:hypothetical protein